MLYQFKPAADLDAVVFSLLNQAEALSHCRENITLLTNHFV
jgi:hypothetical protein